MIISEQNSIIEIVDSTVLVSPIGVRIGNTGIAYRGGNITFGSITDFSSEQAVGYQNSLLYMTNVNGAGDLTSVRSSIVSDRPSLTYPSIPSDSTGAMLSLFTFYGDTSKYLELVSQTEIRG